MTAGRNSPWTLVGLALFGYFLGAALFRLAGAFGVPSYDCAGEDARCSERLGATHWNPCYFIHADKPSLIDGALSLQAVGSRVIKVAVFSPSSQYPWNSPLWKDDSEYTTLLSMVSDTYYRQLWEMDFDTFILIAYSTAGGSAGGDIGYWRWGITEDQIKMETEQLQAAAEFLLENYPDKEFVIENWEGDWASRSPSWDADKPADPEALVAMTKWLQARQDGVTQARQAKRKANQKGNVLFAAEVNLVWNSLQTGFPNMINKVIPYIKTDLISYSSYDTQEDPEKFQAALEYIKTQHVGTPDGPTGADAVFVAEYGLAQQWEPHKIPALMHNVVNSALNFGARYVMFWETYCNECDNNTGSLLGCNANNRCENALHPVDDAANLRGFWLVKPDGTFSYPRNFLARKISGAPGAPLAESDEDEEMDVYN